jgi:hypothetical protein
VAFSVNVGIVAHHSNYKKLVEEANKVGYKRTDYVAEYVYIESVPQRPFRFF